MKTTEIKNKEGEVLKTKDDKPLVENTLEVGDVFIPVWNNVKVDKNEFVDKKGKKGVAENYLILARVREESGVETGEIFLTLTPTQGKTLIKKSKGYTDRNGNVIEAIELNQNRFQAYPYTNGYGDNIGVGLYKDEKPAKTFDDFAQKEE